VSQAFPRPLGEGGGEKPVVAGGGSGPYDPGMDARVSVLETHMEYVRADLAEIKAEQKVTSAAIASLAAATEKLSAKVDATEVRLSAQMATLPTRSDLRNYYTQSLAIGFAFLVLVVGGIVGGLDWIKVH
jgi:predicted membrane-bound dolichyl-phosphate-mannose-protein mannosyltransferase